MSELAARLIPWFIRNDRRLPWRDDPTPYHVWLSEIMLQQTRIEAVIPYYHRFLAHFPTVAALAAADDEELLKCWEGLGYYSRARNLKKCAIAVMTEYNGCLPSDIPSLLRLPGIGPYTAGAIASIAYGKPTPAVDGNVLRVMTRLLCDTGDIMKPETRARISEYLAAAYPPEGDDCRCFTQALMEVGQTVCPPAGAPKCALCPFEDICLAHRTNTEAEYPRKAPKAARRIEERTVLLLRVRNRYAVAKRPDGGLLAGLWEFPSFEGKHSPEDALSIAEGYGLSPVAVTPLKDAKHIFTHIEWHMTGYLIECDRASERFVFATPDEIRDRYAVASAYRAYRKIVLAP